MGLGTRPTVVVSSKSPKGKTPRNSKVVHEVNPKLVNLQALIDKLSKDMGGLGSIGFGSDIQWLDPERIRTGILGLDVLSAGGLPRRSLTQFWGVFSSAKTSTALMVMAAEQRAGRHVLLAPAETFNKQWARELGCWIPYNPKEFAVAEMRSRARKAEWAEERGLMEQYNQSGAGRGEFVLALHPHGDGMLEMVAQAVNSNAISLAVVDSIAVCKPASLLDDNEVGDDERGSGRQIQMLIRFMNRCLSSFSKQYDASGVVKDGGGHHNEVAVLCINQARQVQGGMPQRGGGASYKPSMGDALRHFWNLSVEFRKGEQLGEDDNLGGDRKVFTRHGITVNAHGDKSRVGPQYRNATWQFLITEHGGRKRGTVNPAQEARIWGVYYDVIRKDGAWYTMPDGQRVNGKDAVQEVIENDPGLRQAIEDEVIIRCRQ